MRFILTIFLPVLIWAGIGGCRHDSLIDLIPACDTIPATITNACDPDSVYFVNSILPLLLANCAKSGCHDETTAAGDSESVRLDCYDDIMESGDLVIPYNTHEGKIIQRITTSDDDERMPPPPAGPLTGDQKDLIIQWIQQGAVNNECRN